MSPSPTVRRRRLGRELVQLREQAGLSIEGAVARLAERGHAWSRARMSRVERADTVRLSARDLDALLDAYDAPPERAERLHGLRVEVDQPGWWSAYEGLLSNAYLQFEAEAVRIRTWASQGVPGLLQTPRYAAAVFGAEQPPPSDEEIDQLVQARRHRHVIFDRARPPALWAIIDEAVLRRPIGGPDVMREQLGALLATLDRPGIEVQVLPLAKGAHPGIRGPLTVLDFADAPPLLHSETGFASMLVEDAGRVDDAIDTIKHLQAWALGPEQSAELIEQITFD